MNLSQFMTLAALACAPIAVVGCGFLAVVAYRARLAAAHSLSIASGIAERLAVAEQKLEATARHSSIQARRLAWLESSIRQKKTASRSGIEPVEARKISMTERRHRVLALAQRGMDPELIAETLGEPYGEVELIISLSAVA